MAAVTAFACLPAFDAATFELDDRFTSGIDYEAQHACLVKIVVLPWADQLRAVPFTVNALPIVEVGVADDVLDPGPLIPVPGRLPYPGKIGVPVGWVVRATSHEMNGPRNENVFPGSTRRARDVVCSFEKLPLARHASLRKSRDGAYCHKQYRREHDWNDPSVGMQGNALLRNSNSFIKAQAQR